jgi:translation initiation factor IF-1
VPLDGVLLMNGYITVQEAADKWNITARQVQILCKDNRIVGAKRMSRIWIIPEDAPKPTSRKKNCQKNKGIEN